jgi:protein gp37
MAETTKIEWTDGTWNPIQGCTKVDRDCKFCYMYREKTRYGQDPTKVIRSAPATFRAPLNARKFPPGSKVFSASWSDWFHPDAAPHLADAWAVVAQRPDLAFQILTKRPERIRAELPATWGASGWSNVWLGTSVGNPEAAHRAEALAEIPAVVRFLSLEPVTAPGVATAIRRVVESGAMDWLIIGGESGPEARPMAASWAQELVELGEANGVPVLFKQWGEWAPLVELGGDPRRGDRWLAPRETPKGWEVRTQAWRPGDAGAEAGRWSPWPDELTRQVGKVAAGRVIGGRTLDGYPTPRPGVAPCL